MISGRPSMARAALPGVERSAATMSVLPAKLVGLVRRHDVEQRQLVDLLAVEPAVPGEPLGQLAADHAGGAGDEDMHVVCSLAG